MLRGAAEWRRAGGCCASACVGACVFTAAATPLLLASPEHRCHCCLPILRTECARRLLGPDQAAPPEHPFSERMPGVPGAAAEPAGADRPGECQARCVESFGAWTARSCSDVCARPGQSACPVCVPLHPPLSGFLPELCRCHVPPQELRGYMDLGLHREPNPLPPSLTHIDLSMASDFWEEPPAEVSAHGCCLLLPTERVSLES